MRFRLLLTLALGVTAFAAFAAGASGSAVHHGPGGNQGYRSFEFAGTLLATPGANATSLSLSVTGGNKAALKALIGAPQNQTFTINANTKIYFEASGHVRVHSLAYVRGSVRVTGSGDLLAGDHVRIFINGKWDSTLASLEATAAARVADHRVLVRPHGPLWLFAGTVTGPQSGGMVNLTINDGNWRALHAMLGQPLAQSFAYNSATVFVLWQHGHPSIIDPSQLKAGDEITVRVHASGASTLTQVEATPASRVGDHEPGLHHFG